MTDTRLAVASTEAVAPATDAPISAFSNASNFETAQRIARALAESSVVPVDYRGNLANCLVAIELASRVGASVMAVMQSLAVINGRPAWSAKFLIATVNSCGRFTPLRYRFEGEPATDTWGCRAVAKDKASGEELVGPFVSISMAKAEGWTTKQGSKWKTMPELMLMYRSASFWASVYAPDLSAGMGSAEELSDIPSMSGDASARPAAAVALTAILEEVPS